MNSGIFGLKTWSEEPYGNSSLAATYEYAVTGGITNCILELPWTVD